MSRVSRPGVDGVELLSRDRGVVEAETMLVRVEECRGVSSVSSVSSGCRVAWWEAQGVERCRASVWLARGYTQ